MSEEARVTVNQPVPRADARAPAVVLLGLVGVAGLAFAARRRRVARERAAVGTAPAGSTRSRKRAGLLASAGTIGTALVLRRLGPAELLRLLPLAHEVVRWARQPRPLFAGDGDPADVLTALARSLGADDRGIALLVGAVLGVGAGAPLALLAGRAGADEPSPSAPLHQPVDVASAGRQFGVATLLLYVAVLADSGLEHYRACFENRAMYTPLVMASLGILASGQALAGGSRGQVVCDAVHLAAGGVGLIGLGFHFYNIGKRPGGYCWLNFFYGAPFGAPAALSLAGLIGLAAGRLDEEKPASEQRLAGLPFGRAMAVVTAGGILGTVSEVALLHFRGAYHDPFMWLPVTLPPVAALLLGRAAFGSVEASSGTRAWLQMTALLGLLGVGFHAYGVQRNMGGWYNWSQNILAGPPLPAPPAFSALAIAGLAALDLIGSEGA